MIFIIMYKFFIILFIIIIGQQSRTPTCTWCWLRTWYSRSNGRPAHLMMELIVVVLLSYEGVAPRMRPWIMTTEQRTTIKTGMKTIRHTICLSREQALEYRRYQITFRRGTGCPDRTTGHLWGVGKNFHLRALYTRAA